MTLRDKVIDKYWLEFLVAKEGYDYIYTEKWFWVWFYDEYVNNPKKSMSIKLGDYL